MTALLTKLGNSGYVGRVFFLDEDKMIDGLSAVADTDGLPIFTCDQRSTPGYCQCQPYRLLSVCSHARLHFAFFSRGRFTPNLTIPKRSAVRTSS